MPLRSLWAAPSLWPVLHRLSPIARDAVGPKTYLNRHIYKSGLSRVSHVLHHVFTFHLLLKFSLNSWPFI